MGTDGEGEMGKINVRVPRALLARIDEAWEDRGYANRSEFVRDTLRDAVAPAPTPQEDVLRRGAEGRERRAQGEGPGAPIETDHRREPVVRADELLLSSAIDELLDIFFVVDVGGTFLHWNDNLPDVTGYDDEEIGERQPTDFFEGADARRIENAIGRVVVNGSATEVADIVTKDGRAITHEISGTLIDVGGRQAIAGTARDVRERRERERELERRTERLEAVNHVNAVIRELMAGLLASESREEIAQTACETFAGDEAYRFAWFGSYDARTGQVEPDAWAGEGEGYLDARPAGGVDGEGATALTAVRERAVIFAQDVEADPEADSWRSQALEFGHRSGAAIPVVYGDTTYGCLCLYAGRTDAFGQLEREVFGELGEIVGHAVHAAEMRRALATDTVTELQLQITDEREFLVQAAQSTDAELELVGSVEQPDGAIVNMFTVEGPEPEMVREFAEAAPMEAELVAARDGESVVKATLEGNSISHALAEVGGTVRTITAADGEVRVRADIPRDTDVGTVLRRLREALDVELLAQREVERDDTTGVEFRTDVERHLTDRQLDVLETGLRAGFFDWPREQTGQDVAELLDVSPPTFHQHLRVGQRKLLEVLFDGGSSGERTASTRAGDSPVAKRREQPERSDELDATE